MPDVIGAPFVCEEHRATEVLQGLGVPLVVCANDPPWSGLAPHLGDPLALIHAWDMDIGHLERMAESLRTGHDPDLLGSATVVGIGGGTALDTAKFVSWRLGRPLVQIPSITSVDAGFTDAIGVRDRGRVRYIGEVVPELVVLDLELVRSAPAHLNRAGVGDILSCHTGLFDWRLASDAGHGPPWDERLAGLGITLLDELDAVADEVAAVSETGVRWIADAYRRIGAACSSAGHSRFEEGSEHFWAYAYEHRTGAHPVHGEIISFAVCALAHVQGNDCERARDIVVRSMARAHPGDLEISEADFRSCLGGLAEFSRDAGLDIAVADLRPITIAQIDEAWAFVTSLPRR
jgi:glycerol-1-phosphate dehydrogenase [NAD(P)+]